jgi:hypothetical protein
VISVFSNRPIFENTGLLAGGSCIQPSVKAKTTIPLYERNNYGQAAIYATGPLAEPIARLTGKKTLSMGDIKALQQLGLAFEWARDPRALTLQEAL